MGGALALAATMNLRKVISILVSYIAYAHPISILQFVGLCLVFGALFYKSYDAYHNKDSSKKGKGSAAPKGASESEVKPLELGKAAEEKEDAEEASQNQKA